MRPDTERPALRRERDLGAIISDSFTLQFADWWTFAKLVTPAVLVGAAGQLIVYGAEADEALATALAYLQLPVIFLAYQLCSAAVVASLHAQDQGRPLDVGGALDVAQDRFGDLVGASLRSTGICLLFALTLVGIPWAINRFIRWAFIIQAIIIDAQEGEPSLAYSSDLVKGRWWPTFLKLLLTGMVIGLPAAVLSLIFLVAFPGVPGILLSQATSFLAMPFGIIATTLIFFDLKLRKGPSA